MRFGKVAACFTLALFAVVALASAQPARGRAVAGQILVKFKPSANASVRATAHRGARGRLLREITGKGVVLVAVPEGDEAAAIARYRSHPDVLHAEPNHIRRVPEPAAHGGTAVVPGDKYFAQQWALHNTGQEFYCIEWLFGDLCFYQGTLDADIDAPEAWEISTGTPAITVAVIDTGVDYTHPDLAAHYAGGYDFVSSDFDPQDDHGHGTHVAGTIAASLGNLTGNPAEAEGVVGVAPQARILAYKVCAADGTCSDFAIQQAIARAVADGAKVINLSLGDTVFSQSLNESVQDAWNAGVVIVAGAGNDGTTAPFYPAAFDNVVSVGAFDEGHGRASFSNYGTWVDLSAPGNSILSTYPLSKCEEAGTPGDTGCYAWNSGTSMATPHVAGAAALLWSRGDLTSNAQVVDALLRSADPAGVSSVRLDSWTIHGGLNLHDAMSDGLATGRPVANAGPDQTVKDADGDGVALVSLDGSASQDPDGTLVDHEWREGGSVLGAGALLAVHLTVGTHTLTLEVTDNDGRTGTDTVVVTVEPNSIVTLTVSAAEAREAGLQPGGFMVTRNGDLSAPLTVHYIASGTALAGADYQPLSGTVLIVAGAATAPIGVTPIDDELLESNETVVVALSAGAGYGVGTPASASIAIVSDDLPPDLVILSAAAPGTGGAGADLVVTDTTKNQGAGPAAASVTSFYLSLNSSFDASDVFLGSRPVPRLDPAATHAASTSLRIPEATAPGSYYMVVKSDSDAQVPEGVETNNVKATASFKIGPDLVVPTLTTPAGAVAGGTFTVTDTTRNQGGGGAGPTATRFYLSVNSTLDATDVLIGSRDVPALGPAAVHAGSAVLTVPADTPGRIYFVIAQADGGKILAETSETNNNRANDGLKIGSDLIVSALGVPAIAAVGGTISVSDSTRNQSLEPAGASSTGFYLSANSVLDAADAFLGARPVDVLAPGATSAAATPLQIPPGTAPGSYYIVAKADRAGAVPESDESNNTRLAYIRIGADLMLSGWGAPSSASAGSNVTVNDTTKNQGADPAPESTTKYYLSINSSLDASDVFLGSRPVPALMPGATHAGSATVTIPPQTTPRTYVILAVADGDGTIAEALENNNTSARSISVTAPAAP